MYMSGYCDVMIMASDYTRILEAMAYNEQVNAREHNSLTQDDLQNRSFTMDWMYPEIFYHL